MSGGVRHTLRVGADGRPELLAPAEGETRTEEGEGRTRRAEPGRRGRTWTPEEEASLRAGFQDETPILDLARTLGRSSGAVRARLVMLGLMDEAEAGLRYPVSRSGSPSTPTEAP